MNIKHFLTSLVERAMTDAGLEGQPAIVKQSQKIQFGHYQANGMMAAASKPAQTLERKRAKWLIICNRSVKQRYWL